MSPRRGVRVGNSDAALSASGGPSGGGGGRNGGGGGRNDDGRTGTAHVQQLGWSSRAGTGASCGLVQPGWSVGRILKDIPSGSGAHGISDGSYTGRRGGVASIVAQWNLYYNGMACHARLLGRNEYVESYFLAAMSMLLDHLLHLVGPLVVPR